MTYQKQYSKTALPPQAQEALKAEYSRTAGHKSVAALSQGERDVLDQARQQLGWVSITSLAHKYYKLYPNRQWWKRALFRCSQHKLRTKTLNIVYLLKTLETVMQHALKAAFSGKESLNRLVHTSNIKYNRETNRLAQPGGIANFKEESNRENPLLRRLGSLEALA